MDSEPPTTMEGLGALLLLLRADVRRDADRIETRLRLLQRTDETLTNEITSLQHRLDVAEKQAGKATETALGAMRRAESSLHEIENVSHGLMAHLAKVETDRRQEAAENAALMAGVVDHLKSFARAAEAREQRVALKFDEHRAAIGALSAHGLKLRGWQLGVITAVLSTVVAVVQIGAHVAETWIAHAPQTLDGGR
jgi:phosphoglycolate phosphatase-like HAD superfamily hydrolase